MNRTQAHGVSSLILGGICVALGAAAMFLWWWPLGVAYISSAALAAFSIIYGYCSKCPCQDECGHVFPGKIARVFKRVPSPYTWLEIATLIVALIILFGVPQYWLWKFPLLFTAFWGCAIIASLQIRVQLCATCENEFCPLHLKKQAQ